jgi:hypothetical protein
MFHVAPESKLGALLMGQHRQQGQAPSGQLTIGTIDQRDGRPTGRLEHRSEELRHSLSLN